MASIKSHGDKAGASPKLLWEMLQYLGHQERPLYKGFKEKQEDSVEWRVEVFIYSQKPNPLIIEASGRRSTFGAGIRDAACQAISRIREKYAHELSNTRYRYFPLRRICNTKKKICSYNKHRRQHDGPVLIQQIRLTKALVAVCDEALDELRETRCKVRELGEELEALHGHKVASSVAAPPPPHLLLVANRNNIHDEGVSVGGSSVVTQAQAQGDHPPGTVTPLAPPERTHSSVVVVGNRRATSGMKVAPTGRSPAPCGRHRRLARGAIANENGVSCGAGSSSSIISGASAIPQCQGHRPPSTQKSFFMHPTVKVEVQAPRRDRTPAASSAYERRRHGSNLMPIIADGGAALGKEAGNAKCQ